MFKSYLKIALRNLLKQRSFSLINITGLAIGIACCLLILIYIRDELSFDQFHEKSDRIYRVAGLVSWNGGSEDAASTQFPIARALLNEVPEIESVCRFFRANQNPLMVYEDKRFIENGIMLSDPSIFELFDFEMIAGDPASALQGPASVVITESMAQKYFGKGPALGKFLRYQDETILEVTGVLRDIPSTSHLQFDFLIPFEFSPEMVTGLRLNWYWNAFWTYVLLPNQEAAATLDATFAGLVEKFFPESFRQGSKLYLQPLTDIHLHSNLINEVGPNGNMVYVYIFAVIAVMVLCIACINFMNLATARSMHRAKEIGMRKVLGAGRGSLVRQFYMEACLMSFIAVALAVLLANLSLPFFNQLTAKELSMSYFDNWLVLPGLVGLGLFVGLLSGSYPAFFLSGFVPIKTLKGTFSAASGGATLRKYLVVAQFAVSIILLIGIGVISRQLDYFRNKQLGFAKEQTVLLRSRASVDRQFEAFSNELLGKQGILKVTRAAGSMPSEQPWIYRFLPEGWPADEPIAMPISYVDFDFLEVMDLELVTGRNFAREFITDSSAAMLLNETAVAEFGWTLDEAVGKELSYFGSGSQQIEKNGIVIGVLQDFHFESLHHKVQPLAITLMKNLSTNIVVKISGNDVASVVEHLEKTWSSFVPDWPIEYSFLDSRLGEQYRQEERLGNIIRDFAFLAISIACLGLFGLASFIAEQRTKEMGVRKVLGASIMEIVLLMTRDFIKLVILSFVVAAPIAYATLNLWLQDFAYRVDIGVGTFLAAGGAAITIAVLTVVYQAVKTGMANPIEALRYE